MLELCYKISKISPFIDQLQKTYLWTFKLTWAITFVTHRDTIVKKQDKNTFGQRVSVCERERQKREKGRVKKRERKKESALTSSATTRLAVGCVSSSLD